VQVLRHKGGDQRGLFIVPAGKLVSTAALLLILWLFSSSAWSEVLKTLLAALIGLILYAACAARQRKPRYEIV
jgi:hypothetical protein